jgi:TATA-binding protein-associated factor Taf7
MEEAEERGRIFEEDGWMWMNGLTPPTWGIGRKGQKRKVQELERIEQEVQRLLAADAAAESTFYSLYQNDKLIKTSRADDAISESTNPILEEEQGEEEGSSSYFMSDMEADDLAAELELDLQQQQHDDEEEELTAEQIELENKKAQVESVANPLIRARLQDAIASLEAELKQKQQKKE